MFKKIFRKPSPIFHHWQSMISLSQQISTSTFSFDTHDCTKQAQLLSENILLLSEKKLVLPFDREDISILTQNIFTLTTELIKASSNVQHLRNLPLKLSLKVLPSSLDIVQMIHSALNHLETSLFDLKNGKPTCEPIHEISQLQYKALSMHIESTSTILKEASVCDKEILNAFLTTWHTQKKLLSVLESANQVVWHIQRIQIKYC